MQEAAEDTAKKDYRPDIDGLRALAVLSVIVFHINKHLVPGGFVGVDTFFVISGFLITLHILRDMELGQFSLVEFYRRRVKRIALPLLLVTGIVVLVAQLLMLPEDAQHTADSAIYSVLSLANVYFWLFQDTGYFAADSAQTPLLHLWTLGLEEQFYILWPLLLLLGYRAARARTFLAGSAAIALASFVFAQIWFSHDASFTYYMLPTRAGELLAGALVAVGVLHGVERRIPVRAVFPLAAVALLMLLGSMFVLNDEMVFPGLLALVPTCAAAMLILAGHCARNRVSNLLAFKPLVAIGLLSYSAYLWHWPLLAFYRYEHAEISQTAAWGILILTFVLAGLSYRLIERPARASAAPALRVVVMQYAIPAYLVACTALFVIYYDGFGIRWESIRGSIVADEYTEEPAEIAGQRLPESAAASAIDPRVTLQYPKPKAAYQFDYVCQRERASFVDLHNPNCVLGSGDNHEVRTILWGDSNAGHYVGLVGAIARKAGFRFRNIEIESCPPLAGDPEPFVAARRLADCRASSELVLPDVQRADVVIIAASWSDYASRSERFFDQFFATVKGLTDAGKYVLILGKAPEIKGYEWECVGKQGGLAAPGACPFISAPESYVLEANARLKAFSEKNRNVGFFDVTSYLCPGGTCTAFDPQGAPIYFDAAHLSLPGSWQLGDEVLHKEGVPPPFSRITSQLRQHG